MKIIKCENDHIIVCYEPMNNLACVGIYYLEQKDHTDFIMVVSALGFHHNGNVFNVSNC